MTDSYHMGFKDGQQSLIDQGYEKVEHGRWVNDGGLYKCTACNDLLTVAGWASCIPEKQIYKVFKYCPNCGAAMNEVTE